MLHAHHAIRAISLVSAPACFTVEVAFCDNRLMHWSSSPEIPPNSLSYGASSQEFFITRLPGYQATRQPGNQDVGRPAECFLPLSQGHTRVRNGVLGFLPDSHSTSAAASISRRGQSILWSNQSRACPSGCPSPSTRIQQAEVGLAWNASQDMVDF